MAGVDDVREFHRAVRPQLSHKGLLYLQNLPIRAYELLPVARSEPHRHRNVHIRVPLARVELHEAALEPQLYLLVVELVDKVQNVAAQRLEEHFGIHSGDELKALVHRFFHDGGTSRRVLQGIGF